MKMWAVSLLLLGALATTQSCKKENGLTSVTSTSSSWNCGTFSCDASLSIPELTSEIVNNGLVMVYMVIPGAGQVALPFINNTQIFEIALIETGYITLGYFDTDAVGSPFPPSYRTFKVVLVENWKSGQFNHIDKNDFRAMSKIASKVIDVEINN